MPRYSFVARNMKGEVVRELLDAPSIKDARAVLVERGLLLEEIHEDVAPSPTLDSLSGAPAPGWTTVDDHVGEPSKATSQPKVLQRTDSPHLYFPFLETIRLYAGWLMAWYLGIYALGYYQQSRGLPFALTYIENLYKSPLVLSFTLGAFIFLLITTLHRALGRGKILGVILFLLGIGIFLLYRKTIG